MKRAKGAPNVIIAWRLTAQFFGGTSPEHDSGSARKPRIPLTATEAERLSKRKRPCTMATPERSKSAGVSYRRTQISILLSRALTCVEFTCRSNAVSVSATFLTIGTTTMHEKERFFLHGRERHHGFGARAAEARRERLCSWPF